LKEKGKRGMVTGSQVETRQEFKKMMSKEIIEGGKDAVM
jgi:hypothetical protein